MSERASVLVVGASVAASALIGQLRANGHTGRVVVVDSDPDAPYDRPPLSKHFLSSEDDHPAAPWWCEDCELWAGRAERLDTSARTATVRLPDGSTIDVTADELVIATGSAPFRLPCQPDGVLELRTAADARELRARTAAGRRVVVLGAGTIGTELASSLTEIGAVVTLVDLAERPLQRFLGGHLGEEAAAWIRAGGVDLHLGARVRAISTSSDCWVVETDCARLRGDIVVSAVGTRPATEWLEGSGIATGDGVLCDADGQVLRSDGSTIHGVHAVGDVANWLDTDGIRRRREDWTSAQRQGRHVARRLLGLDPLVCLGSERDYFWSHQFGRRIQVLGTPAPEGTLVRHVEDPERLAAFYTVESGGDTVAWISVNRPREFALAMREPVAAGH